VNILLSLFSDYYSISDYTASDSGFYWVMWEGWPRTQSWPYSE